MVTKDFIQSFNPTSEKAADFPGMDLFSKAQAEQLGFVIRDFTLLQPISVQKICEDKGIGWLENGSPDTLGVNKIEHIVKTRGCAALALETIRTLGGNLSSEEILDIIDKSGLVYELIPQTVYAAIKAK